MIKRPCFLTPPSWCHRLFNILLLYTFSGGLYFVLFRMNISFPSCSFFYSNTVLPITSLHGFIIALCSVHLDASYISTLDLLLDNSWICTQTFNPQLLKGIHMSCETMNKLYNLYLASLSVNQWGQEHLVQKCVREVGGGRKCVNLMKELAVLGTCLALSWWID